MLACGCSSGGLKERHALRANYVRGDFAGSLKTVKESKFYNDEDSRLLQAFELGLIYHSAGQYYQSLQAFNRAKAIYNKTILRISGKLKTLLLNGNYEQYYSEVYEASMLHFYISLNHFLLYQLGEYEAFTQSEKKIAAVKLTAKQRRTHLMGARAELLAWDSFMKEQKQERLGKTVFKLDLLAKVFGGAVHEAFDRRADDQIAWQLYQDAKQVLFRNYNAYKSFNGSSEKFKGNYEKLPAMKKTEVTRQFVAPTAFAGQLDEYLNEKILRLTRRLRPRRLKSTAQKIGASDDLVKKIQKDKGRRDNITIVLQEGIIPKKQADKFNFGLQGLMDKAKDNKTKRMIRAVGLPLLTHFIVHKLKLLPSREHWTYPGAHAGFAMGQIAAQTFGITFELPMLKASIINQTSKLVVRDIAGKRIQEKVIPLVNPLGDIAEEAITEHAVAAFTKTGTRVALKHVSAIAASYGVYKALAKNKDNDFFARNAALLNYLAAAKVIEKTEKADTRYWSTLPRSVRILDLYLPPGAYQLQIEMTRLDEPSNIKTYLLGDLQVGANDSKKLVNFRGNFFAR